VKHVTRIAIVALALIVISSVTATLYRVFHDDSRQLYNNAVHLYNNWQNKKAEREIIPLLKNNPENLSAGFLYGNILFRLGKLNQSKKIFSALAVKDSLRKVESLLKLAHTLFFLNDLDSAGVVLNEVHKLATRDKDSLAIARSYYLSGLIAFNSLDYKTAMKLQKKSLALAIRLNDKQEQADALRQIGVLYWYSSRHDSALANYYKPALKIYREINDKIGEATTLSNMGLIYKDQEHVNKSIDYQLRAFLLQQQTGDQIGLANSYYFLNNLISIAGWHSSISYNLLHKSYSISQRIGYKWGMEVSDRALRNYFFSNPDLSFQKLAVSDSILSNVGEGAIYTLWDKILELKRKRDYKNEITNLNRYVRICDSLGYHNGEQVALGNLAFALANDSRFTEAESALKKAQLITSDIHLTTDFLLDTTKVRLDLKKGEIKKAASALIRLAQRYDSLYMSSISPENNTVIEHDISRIHQKRNAIYSQLIDVLYSLHDKRLYEYVQKERSIPFWWRTNANYSDIDQDNHDAMGKFIESLENSNEASNSSDYVQSLTGYFSDKEKELNKMSAAISGYISNEDNQLVISSRELQKQLGKNEVVAEYFVNNRELLIFVTRNETSSVIRSDISESRLHSLVTIYNGAIERGAENPDDDLWKGISHHLYSLVIDPIVKKGLLNEGDHLIISPHKILHLLSFQTLDVVPSDQPVSFSVEHYDISYIPSASFFVQRKNRKKPKYNSMVTIAPDINSLPGIAAEIRNIPKNYVRRFASLKDDRAKKDSVLEAFKKFDVVHIASHAQVNQWFPLFSTIECSDNPLKLYEILQEKINAKLVILSACDTGLSLSSSGGLPDDEDIISFSRALLAKGTSAVIATYWMVNDSSTVHFMNLFYQRMFPEPSHQLDNSKANLHVSRISIDKLLNDVQRQWITDRRKAGMSDHPFYWGSFFVSGGSI